jgi:hypothetical protein
VPDLMQCLTETAVAAIEDERPGLTYDAGWLKTVTVELEVSLSGSGVVGNVYIHRRGTSRCAAARAMRPAIASSRRSSASGSVRRVGRVSSVRLVVGMLLRRRRSGLSGSWGGRDAGPCTTGLRSAWNASRPTS